MIFLTLLACADNGDKSDTADTADAISVEIPFRARVGGEAFRCGETFSGLGTAESEVDPVDLRFYVHDVALTDASGASQPLTLEQDGVWQRDDVALLDFEDGSGDCATGSPDTHTALTGTVPAGDYVGLSFNIGVPDALNHIDAATAEAPLNDTGMWWSWTGGYKFLKIDAGTSAGNTFVFHLGATDCAKLEDGTYSCTLENQASVALADFDPEADAVALDLADLYATSDLSGALAEGDMMPGCMSSEGDPECTQLFAALGLPWGDAGAPAAQTVFQVEAR